MEHTNYDWEAVITPVRTSVLKQCLEETGYPIKKINHLVTGFQQGFELGYKGTFNRRNLANNLPFRVGTPTDLLNKIMTEVEAKCYAGPYNMNELPFKQFVQSPVGLVPKSGNKMRLIFHLSFDFGDDENSKSINHHIPSEDCKVKYNALDHAIANSLRILCEASEQEGVNGENSCLFYTKTDCSHAFRILPILVRHRRAFTKGMYSKLKLTDGCGNPLKQHHYVWLNQEFVRDCEVWKVFLHEAQTGYHLCRPFIDFDKNGINLKTLNFYSDASRNPNFGMGAYYDNHWMFKKWTKHFVEECEPSIEYFELYVLVAALVTWGNDKKTPQW